LHDPFLVIDPFALAKTTYFALMGAGAEQEVRSSHQLMFSVPFHSVYSSNPWRFEHSRGGKTTPPARLLLEGGRGFL